MDAEGDEPAVPGALAGLFSGDLSIGEVLEQLRRRLLDLTARNRLLNFRHSQTKTAQVVDAVPNSVYEKLLDGRTITFVPVPDPSPGEYEGENRTQKPELREYAKKLGIGTSYELSGRQNNTPARGNEGLKLRVLAYPEETERLCRRICKEARSAIEETGTNMLYLVFGFLEFYESDQSERTLLAPLIAVPVAMKRGATDRQSRLPLYDIIYTGDELAENLSLREKLRAEFSMTLPEIGEDADPDAYFAEIAEAIETRPRWKVRRQITLALLSFAKMLLVNDLDPKNWPKGFNRSKLEEHQIVRTVFGDFTPDEGAGIEPPDYEIDNHKKNNLALIYDADTSQHSALIDALEGKNLVVNGPPGTGKSQTITNLIAESLVRGKKVLFVSEKLAALEVVRNRLGQAKLGDFCLELHSHKTQKKRVLEDLTARLNGRFPLPHGLDGNLELLEQQKKQLQAYADMMNTRLGNELELTVFDILWRAERHRQEANEAAAFLNDIVVPDAPHCGQARLGSITGDVASLAQHFEAIGQYGINHPWFGFFPTQLRPGDDLEIQTVLTALVEGADGIDRALNALKAVTDDAELPRGMTAQMALAATLKELTAPSESVYAELLPCLFRPDGTGGSESAKTISSLKVRVKEAKRLIAATSGKLNPDASVTQEMLEKAKTWRHRLSRHSAESLSLSVITSKKDEIAALLAGISRSLAFYSGLCGLLARAPEQSDIGLQKVLAVVQVCNEAPKELLEYRLVSFGRPSTKDLAAKASTEFARLKELRGELSQLFYLDERPDDQALVSAIQTLREGDAWYRLFQGHWRRARKFYKGLARNKTRLPATDCVEHLTALSKFLRDHEHFEDNPDHKEAFGRLFKGDETDYGKIGRLITWYERAEEIFATASLAPGEFDFSAVEAYRIVQLSEQFSLGQTHSRALIDALARLIVLSEGSHTAREIQGPNSTWPHRMEAAQTLGLELGEGAHFFKEFGPDSLSPEEITQSLSKQLALRSLLESIEGDSEVRELIHAHYAGLDTNFDGLEHTLAWGRTIAIAPLPSKIRALLLNAEAKQRFPEVQRAGIALVDAWSTVRNVADQLGGLAEFGWDQWHSGFVDTPGEEATDAIRMRAQLALDSLDGLLSWSQYLNARERVIRLNLKAFAQKLEAGVVPHTLLVPGFLYRFFASIAQSLFRANAILSRFSGMSHNQVRETFVRLDREVIEMRGQECGARIHANMHPPPGIAAVRVDDRTEMALLRHLMSLQRPRTPIRQMMKRAGRAIQVLKPCFMMGPLAVAQYLEPGAVEFDIVIMDEASQLKVEEAIGAVARGAQLVVVGDQNQLPPTSFFDRMMSVDDEDDDSQANAATSSESILDLCCPVFSQRTLKWHYRSKHESLIAFSNQRFYDGQLFVFPSPYPKTKHLGLRYHYVGNGVYQNRQNIPEARRVVDAVIEHMQSRPTESLGVATLNITQRDLIDELLEQRLRSFEPGEQFRAHWENEGWPFFVKNLENVQGDERDVIFVSTTFGKARGTNVVRQNFGPINKEHGWRRLNVLFTRARKSLHVYSSMQPEDIVVDDKTPRGMAALRDYLEYASRGILAETTVGSREPDSDFEIAVINVLKAKGYDVQPQLGVAKFFVDIAVRNPDRRGEFMAAIECDGATYHSGVSVRDRDRIRQEILENLGWKDRIWRIWSTDWFRNPQREIEKLAWFLVQRREASANEPPPYFDEPEPKPDPGPIRKAPAPDAASVSRTTPIQPTLFEPEMPLFATAGVSEDEELFVEVGDKVVYVDQDNPSEKNSFTIVADGHIPAAGLINEAKPLAQVFLGASEGEIVKLEIENRPTKQFRLLKIERAEAHANTVSNS